MKSKASGRVRTVGPSSYVEPELYEAARRAAFEGHCSVSDIARKALLAYLGKGKGLKAVR